MADNNQTSDNSQPVDKTTTKKSTKMQKSSTKGDAIDKGRTMTGSKPDKIDMNPEFYHNVNSSFEADFGTPINELNVQQRLKKALNFRKIKNKVQLARKRAMLRKGTGKVIAKRAKVLAIKMLKSKLAGNREVGSLSPMEKQRVEKLIGKRSAAVKRLALRLIPAVKKKEAKRFIKKESIDLDNLAEAVAFINESINSAAGGGIRGMGNVTGHPDGEPSNYVNANIVDFDKRNDEMKNTKSDHDKLHLKKESVKLDPNDSHQRDDGTNMLVRTFKHDTPGETNKLHNHFKRTAKPVPKNIDKAFESFVDEETREAVPRSGQPRKKLDLTARSIGTNRKTSTSPYRQQEIQKKKIDEDTVEEGMKSKIAGAALMGISALAASHGKANASDTANKSPTHASQQVDNGEARAGESTKSAMNRMNAHKTPEAKADFLHKYVKSALDKGGFTDGRFAAHTSSMKKEENIIDEQLIILENAIASIDKGEYDFEGAMARTQLQTIYRNAKNLIDTLKSDENMPEWVQSKITLAQDYIACVSDYLQSRKELGEAKKMGNPCWKGYKAYGMKKKNGKEVPNCVPVKEDSPAWQRKEGKNQEGGLNQKGVDSYRRENPGSKLKTAVTTKPSKLDPDSKAAKRRKSFCARMSGMKKQNTSAKTANDPDSRINKSLRKWNC